MDKGILNMYGFDIEGDSLYFINQLINAIFHMDLITGKVECTKVLEKYHLFDGFLYRDLHIDGDKIWFVPYAADDLLIYNLRSDTCEYINIPKLEGYGRKYVKFCGIHDYGEWFILVPDEYPAILKINKKTYEMIITKWEKELLEKYPDFIKDNQYVGILSRNYEVFKDTLYLFTANISIQYHMGSGILNFCEVGHEKTMLSGIARYGDNFAVADRANAELVIWEETKNRILKHYNLGYKGYSVGDDGGLLWLHKINGGVVIAQSKDNFLRFLDNAGEFHKIDLDIEKGEKNEDFFEYIKQKDNNIVIPLGEQNVVLIVNTDDWSLQRIDMKFSSFESLIKEVEEKDYIVENNVFYELRDLIDRLKKTEIEGTKAMKTGNLGFYIYQNV